MQGTPPGLTGFDPQTQGRPAGAVQPWATVWNPFRIRERSATSWATAPPCVRLPLGPLAKPKGVAIGFTEHKTTTHYKQRGAEDLNKANHDAEMLPECDFSKAVLGKYAGRFREGTNLVLLEPAVRKAFPDSKAVNSALRGLLRATKKPAR